jgi:hypothetical protein
MAENVAVDRLLGEIVAALDGELSFPYDAAEGVHACEILLGKMPFYLCFRERFWTNSSSTTCRNSSFSREERRICFAAYGR